eukprot:2990235-Rhodomonas_salina.1
MLQPRAFRSHLLRMHACLRPAAACRTASLSLLLLLLLSLLLCLHAAAVASAAVRECCVLQLRLPRVRRRWAVRRRVCARARGVGAA